MIRLIFYKELKEIFRTSKVVWMVTGVFILMALALYNGYSSYVKHSTLLRESQQTTYQQFISQGDKNPHLGAHFGFYAYKPAADLAMIDNGIEDYTGNSFYLEPHKRGIVKFKDVADATGLINFGFFNAGYFAEFILPLFIFLICHNIFSKEWENGTIKMVLSSKATTKQVFTGKLLACLTLIFGMLMVLALSGLGLLLMAQASDRVGNILVVYSCYLLGLGLFALMMTIIGVSVSLLTRSSSLSLVVLSGFWLIGVFLIPRLSSEVSKNIYPPITSLDFENTTFHDKQYGVNGQGHKDTRRVFLMDSVMKQYHVKRIEDMPVYFIPIDIEYFEDTDADVMNGAYSSIDTNETLQNRFVLTASALSPFLAFRDFSMRLTATDMHTHHDFTVKAEEHRRVISEIVNTFYQKNVVASNDFWKTIPQFSYEAPGIAGRLSSAMWSIITLISWAIASVLLMVFSYRKMTV